MQENKPDRTREWPVKECQYFCERAVSGHETTQGPFDRRVYNQYPSKSFILYMYSRKIWQRIKFGGLAVGVETIKLKSTNIIFARNT